MLHGRAALAPYCLKNCDQDAAWRIYPKGVWFGEGPPQGPAGCAFPKELWYFPAQKTWNEAQKNVFLEKHTHSTNICVRSHNQNHIVYNACSSSGIQKVCGCAGALNTTETCVWYLHTISFRPLSKAYKTRDNICPSWSAGRIPGKQNKNSLMLSTSSRKASVASCSIMFYSYWGLWSTLYVLSTWRKHLPFFYIETLSVCFSCWRLIFLMFFLVSWKARPLMSKNLTSSSVWSLQFTRTEGER